jgi:mono/diheme cytochrome c family protein
MLKCMAYGGADPPDARRAFWIIKHGIKMSAMPAWGRTLEDGEIWDLVAFVRKPPSMSPEAYRRLAQ